MSKHFWKVEKIEKSHILSKCNNCNIYKLGLQIDNNLYDVFTYELPVIDYVDNKTICILDNTSSNTDPGCLTTNDINKFVK